MDVDMVQVHIMDTRQTMEHRVMVDVVVDQVVIVIQVIEVVGLEIKDIMVEVVDHNTTQVVVEVPVPSVLVQQTDLMVVRVD
jgi:hypothetical protein